MTPSPTIRLFVSSTFSDLKAERDALRRQVIPRLKQLCLSRGLRFHAVELRRRCRQDRPKPNFLILLADPNSWRPLPEIIRASVFEELKRRLTADHTDDTDGANILGKRIK